jgi:hypothetical protein
VVALSLVRDVAKSFRVDSRRANAIILEVTKAVRGWRKEAKKRGLARDAMDRMAPAFRVAEA